MFKAGDRIRLKDHSGWRDHEVHRVQTATVVECADRGALPYRVQWDDGKYSRVTFGNMFSAVAQEWDNESNI